MSEDIQGLTPAELRRKTQVGRVVSDKMDKTVVVAVETLYRHPLYHKTMKQTKRFMVHDEHEMCQVGDRVRIVETRPLSRHKRWRVVEIVSHDLLAGVEPSAGEEEFEEITRSLRAEEEAPAADEEEAAEVSAVPVADEEPLVGEGEEAMDTAGEPVDEEEAADAAPGEVEVGE